MIQGITRAWSKTVDAASIQARNSRSIREVLRAVVYGSLGAEAYLLYQVVGLTKIGKIDLASASLFGGAFTLIGTILTVAIPAFVNSLKDDDNTPPTPPQGAAG